MQAVDVERMIEAAITDARAEAVDLRGGGDHFEVTVISECFEGQSLVERHRMVYVALSAAMDTDIHALTIRAVTPCEQQQESISQEQGVD